MYCVKITAAPWFLCSHWGNRKIENRTVIVSHKTWPHFRYVKSQKFKILSNPWIFIQKETFSFSSASNWQHLPSPLTSSSSYLFSFISSESQVMGGKKKIKGMNGITFTCLVSDKIIFWLPTLWTRHMLTLLWTHLWAPQKPPLSLLTTAALTDERHIFFGSLFSIPHHLLFHQPSISQRFHCWDSLILW